ncbi:MAG: hypothetical protein F9K18_03455 [Thermoanaerobaculia bacterium]|nr:MAG: hypothetical protein F9K18_03455 [Thermoanaerobaculia bacterium]
MAKDFDDEVQAIKAVLGSLEPLDAQARKSVVEYVLKRLGITAGPAAPAPLAPLAPAAPGSLSTAATPPAAEGPLHIESFKNLKQPRSANEMAALVAYYLQNLAPTAERKATVTTQDLETYFKIAKFPLPKEIRVTLQNARNAGYLDAAGSGEYKLNAVGHNLVVHNMPRNAAAPAKAAKRAKKKTARPKRK